MIKRNSIANLGGAVEVPDRSSVFVGAMSTLNQKFAFEFAALTKIQSILSIRLVNVLSKQAKKGGLILETFANDTR